MTAPNTSASAAALARPISSVARCWTYETACLLGADIQLGKMPPNEYYDALGKLLPKWWPEADPELLQHVVPVIAAFGTATAFALSFGISKFALAQWETKLQRSARKLTAGRA